MICRLCGHAEFDGVIDLGPQRPAGHFPRPGDPPRAPRPLHVVACRRCTLAQLTETVDPVLQFGGPYGYRSGLNEQMVTHLQGLAASAIGHLGRRPRAVLDIGCNDGTLLTEFPQARRVGIDPGPWLDLAAATGVHALRGFFPALSPDGERFDLVFTVAMFYDLDAPLAAATRIAALLAPGGRWICEVADWPRCVREGIWDGICHEHLTYWTPPAMRMLAATVGLEVLAIEPTDANGGSLRYVIGQGNPQPAAELPRPDYPAFRRAVAESIWAIRGTVLTRARQGQVVHLYGASTKGNVLLQACGLGPESLPLAAERSPHKVGTTTATGIPIVTEAVSRLARPTAYLVGPWHFRPTILQRERLQGSPEPDFIFPLPSPVTTVEGHRPVEAVR